MKRIISLALVAVLLCATIAPVSAVSADNTVQPRWTYIRLMNANIDINWIGVASCSGEVNAYESMDVKVLVRLQQLTDSGWSTIKTWSVTGVGAARASGVYAVHSGYTYRVSVTGYVYDDNGNLLEAGSTSDTFVY